MKQPGNESASGDALPAGTRLAEFELERVLGEGGFSFVYLAFDHTLERHVAIKEYLPSAYALRRDDGTVAPRSGDRQATFEAGLKSFIDEARLLAKFEHPALVKVLRFWEANGTAYMAMPHYQGRTLREIIRTDPAYASEARLKALIAPLLDAVEQLHAERCYHRDIAPDNIIVQPNGAPVLLDFGAARRIIGDMTHALTVVLKPGYAPIEQYAEEGGPAQGPWTDVYAFAAVLYAAITGKAPVAAVARAYSDSLVRLQDTPHAGYSIEFLRAIDAALAVRPEARPQSIAAFRDSLGPAGDLGNDVTLVLSRPHAAPGRVSSADAAASIAPPPGSRSVSLPTAAAATTANGAIPTRAPAAAAGPLRRRALVGAGVAATLALAIGAVVVYTSRVGPPASSRAPTNAVAPPNALGPTPAAVAPAGVAPAPVAPPAVATAPPAVATRTPAVATAPPAVATAPPAVATAEVPKPPGPDPRAALRAALSEFDCAHASYALDASGVVAVSGHVQDAAQRTALERRLRAVAGVTDVQSRLALVPKPFCEVTSAIAGLSTADSGTLEVRVTQPKPPLRIGQQGVHLEVVGPAFASNIAVDVWSLAEKQPARLDVAHLLPHAGYSLSSEFKANERKTITKISDGPKPVDIQVYPPPGTLLITAIASERPLVRKNRALTGDPRQYIAAIRSDAEGLGPSAQVATWYGFVKVLP